MKYIILFIFLSSQLYSQVKQTNENGDNMYNSRKVTNNNYLYINNPYYGDSRIEFNNNNQYNIELKNSFKDSTYINILILPFNNIIQSDQCKGIDISNIIFEIINKYCKENSIYFNVVYYPEYNIKGIYTDEIKAIRDDTDADLIIYGNYIYSCNNDSASICINYSSRLKSPKINLLCDEINVKYNFIESKEIGIDYKKINLTNINESEVNTRILYLCNMLYAIDQFNKNKIPNIQILNALKFSSNFQDSLKPMVLYNLHLDTSSSNVEIRDYFNNYIQKKLSCPGLKSYIDYLTNIKLRYIYKYYSNKNLNEQNDSLSDYTKFIKFICIKDTSWINQTNLNKLVSNLEIISNFSSIYYTTFFIQSEKDSNHYLNNLYRYYYCINRNYDSIVKYSSYYINSFNTTHKYNFDFVNLDLYKIHLFMRAFAYSLKKDDINFNKDYYELSYYDENFIYQGCKENANIYQIRAYYLYNKAIYDSAIYYNYKSIELYSSNKYTGFLYAHLLEIGTIYFNTYINDSAFVIFKEALDIDSNSVTVINYLGAISCKLEHYEEAIKYYDKLLLLGHQDLCYYNLLFASIKLKEKKLAMKYYKYFIKYYVDNKSISNKIKSLKKLINKI